MVEKIAELDLELSEGDITQKGYEKKKTKLLAPFLRENQVNNTKTEDQKNGVKVRQTNGSSHSHQPPSSSSSSTSATPSAPPAPQADSSQASGASGMSDSSGKTEYWKCLIILSSTLFSSGLSISGQESVLSQQNKPRSRRTHRRYYNEKRFDAPRG